MFDYGALPPEINSARMYRGGGSGSMMAAAAAWDALAGAMESASRGYSSVIAQLQGESWSGGASVAMVKAAAPYISWLTTAATQAEEAASRARAAAAAYEAAFAATVPPALVTANRTQLAALLATNVFGQNTGMIAATEAQYERMWSQDAAAMYSYAASSSAATALTRFTQPPQTTNTAAALTQAAATTAATDTSTSGSAQTVLSQLMASVPQQLQALATTGTSSSSASAAASPLAELESLVPSPLLTAFSNFNTFTSPINLGDGISRTLTSAGSFGTGAQRVGLQEAGAAAKAVAGGAAHEAGASAAVMRGPVLASAGTGTTLGTMSVPQSWTITNPALTPVAEPHWLSDADLGGGPSWQEVPVSNMWNGVPAAGTGAKSGLLSGSSVNNMLRVGPRKFTMPRPSLGG
jgi:PPE-repeat protein